MVTPEMKINATLSTSSMGTSHVVEEECAKQPHWYYFICSSLITFLACMFLVLLGRAVKWLCCGVILGACVEGQKLESAQNGGDGSKRPAALSSDGSGKRGADADGADEAVQIGWATEAKDWAGELISGQTTTGRILVRQFTHK